MDRRISCRTLLLVSLIGGLALVALAGWLLYLGEQSTEETPDQETLETSITETSSPVVPVSPDPTSPPYWDQVYVEYILDASGSMLAEMNGERKIDIAKDVLATKAGQLPATTNVGLRVYGHRVHYSDEERSCQDIELMVPPIRGGQEQILDKLQTLEAQGMTPLSKAIIRSVNDFDHADPSRYNSLVIVSDGEETCGGDPCSLADDLVNVHGIHFTMYVIGFDILDNPTAQTQLRCLAEKTSGVYLEANSEDELTRALDGVWDMLDRRAAIALVEQKPTAVVVETPIQEPKSVTPTAAVVTPSETPSQEPNPPLPTEGSATPRGRIAFRSDDDDIFVINPDGSGLTNLTDSPKAADWSPVWSPDGTRIAFTSNRDSGTTNRDIYVVNTDGSGLTRLTHGLNGKRPSWSPDGARVAFESRQDSNHYLYVVNTDGSNLTELVNNDFGFYGLSWSPDGTRILFATSHNDNDEIFVINADGSELTNLSNHPASDMYPAWSPDGTRILFETYHDDNDEIYVMNIDGSGRTNLTNHPAEDSSPAWSPDGTHIAFASDREKTEGSNIFNDTEIYVMNADGSGLIRLTNRVGFDAYPSWSPDGTRIAFTSKRSDDWTIHIVNADGTGLYYLIGGLENDERALWSPVGQSASISQSTIPAPALPTVQIIQDGAPFCLRWLDFKNPDRNLEKGSWISVHGSYRDLNNDWWLAVELEDGTKGWVQNFGVALEGLDVETLPQLVPDSW